MQVSYKKLATRKKLKMASSQSSDELARFPTPRDVFCNGQRIGFSQGASHPLRQIFLSYDRDMNGVLSDSEFRRFLNEHFSHYLPGFSNSATRLMCKLFEKLAGPKGYLEFDDFVQLWHFLNEWNQIFLEADSDGSLSIEYREYLVAVRRVFGEKDYTELLLPDLMVVATVFKGFCDLTPFSLSFLGFVESILFLLRAVDSFNYNTDDADSDGSSSVVPNMQPPTRQFTLHGFVGSALRLRY